MTTLNIISQKMYIKALLPVINYFDSTMPVRKPTSLILDLSLNRWQTANTAKTDC